MEFFIKTHFLRQISINNFSLGNIVGDRRMPPVEFSPVTIPEEKLENRVTQRNSNSYLVIIVFGVVLFTTIIIVSFIIRWIYKIRKYNKLRHYLIPIYTFDPNDEENWDTGYQERTFLYGT